MVQRGGAHYPQIWGAPDQSVAGDGLGPGDQKLQQKQPIVRLQHGCNYIISFMLNWRDLLDEKIA
jgi:hypothetical protein